MHGVCWLLWAQDGFGGEKAQHLKIKTINQLHRIRDMNLPIH
jgi:hypothetical protein